MKHNEDHVDRLTELFTDLLFSLTDKNATAVDAGGMNTQTLDTFANTMYHDFYLH